MKQKDVLLIVVVLLLVGIVKLFRSGGDIIDRKEEDGRPFYRHLDSPRSFSFPPEDFSHIQRIVIDNPAGSLIVLPAEGDGVTLQSTLIVYDPSEKAAGELQERLRINRKVEPGGLLRIDAGTADPEMEGRFRMDHTLWVPEAISIDASTRHGDVEMAHGSADLKLRQAFGKVEISEWAGKLDLEAENSSLQVINCSGEQRIAAQNCEIDIQNADLLELNPRRCQVQITGVRGNLLIRKALLNRIEIDSSTNVSVFGSGDHITLGNASGSTRIRDEFEEIRLENVSGELSLESKRSQVRLKNVQASRLFARCSFRDAEFSRISFQSARIELHQSDLRLELREIGSELEVEGVHSDVTLTLPEQLVYSAEFIAKMGKVHAPSDASFQFTEERGLQRLSREISGGVKLRVNISYGDVRIGLAEAE